ncbi:transcriptional regulator [Streptomyces sp. NPDC048603]|uniref:transcriptional regulator n=1 Tax=Streptomyces sp. NPDC048603 TaxID=3365577 RepID=UPI00371B04C6
MDVAGPGVDPWPGRATVPAGEPAGERFPASEQGADEGATAEATLGAEPRSALGAVPDAGSASAPGQAPAEGGSERGTGPAPGAGSGGEPEPAIALTTGTDAGSVRGDSWYRGRRAVAGAVVGVAAVALAATALAVAGPLGRDGADRAAGTGTTTSSPRAGASGGADDPRPPAPTTGPSQGTGGTQSSTTGPGPGPGPGTSASASGGPVPGRTPGASTAPAPGPNTSSPASGSAPRLRAAVRSHVWANGCDHAYLIDRNPGSVPAPPVEADAPGWAAAQGAVHAGQQIVEATLHGTGSEAIVVQGIDVRVTARRTPLPWNVHLMSPGCGGALTPASFTVNLDAPRPVARPAAGHDGEHPVPAPAFPLRVSATDPVVLRIEAAASGCDCEWYGEVRWTGPAGPGLTRIDDNGRPLRTSASGGRPQYGYAAELGRWSRG